MKRAGMPMAAAVAAGSIWLLGCDPGSFQFGRWGRDSADSSPRVTSDPVSDSVETPQGPAADGRAAPDLAEQVQNFLSRFPSNDRDKAGQTGSPPADASEAPPPPPGFARNQARLGIVGSLESSPKRMNVFTGNAATAPSAGGAPSPPVSQQAVQVEAAASPDSKPMRAANPSPSASPRVELLDVRAATPSAVTAAPTAGPNANQPISPGADPPAAGIQELIAQLEESVRQHPQRIDDQFRLRLLYAATGQEARATGPLEGVDPVQGELMVTVLRAVLATRRSMQDPSGSAAPAISAADELRRLLGVQSSVIVPRLALVTRVNSFGDYDAVDPPQFPGGKPVHVFLYTEVKNFRSEATSDNRLRTVLAEKVEIFNAAGKVVWQRAEPTIEDRSHSPRTDFFMTMEIELPADLPVGEYVLKVSVEDKLGATTDQQRLTFRIGSK